MLSRRNFISSVSAASVAAGLGMARSTHANALPPQLATAKAQLYNFIKLLAEGNGLGGSQRIVLNSTIIPFDLSAETPYFNEQMFRQYADRTFHGGTEALRESSPASQAERFSSQYRSILNLAAAQIDQHHPEIANSLAELDRQLTVASEQFNAKVLALEELWDRIAESRKLKPGTPDFELQRITWMAQVRYGDQIQRYSENIDALGLKIDAARRKVYTPAEMAVLENLSVLSRAYNINRPWNAQTERSWKASGMPLNDILLSDFTRLPPALFDSAPLVMPIGDLTAFLAGKGKRTFDTMTASSTMDSGTDSWSASGGGSFMGWSLGGGGSGSSSFSKSMSKLNSIKIGFENIAEYLVDRSAWFNPAVLQDPATRKLVNNRRELNNLEYISVGLIICRGLSLELKFSEKVNSADWSQSSISAGGGASFCGFSFHASGGRSSTRTSIKSDEAGTTVTFTDDGNVVRVLGVRVEPFLAGKGVSERVESLTVNNAGLKAKFDALKTGKENYIDFQKAKVDTMNRLMGLTQ